MQLYPAGTKTMRLILLALAVLLATAHAARAQPLPADQEGFRQALRQQAERRLAVVKVDREAEPFLERLQRDAVLGVYEPGTKPEPYRDLRPAPSDQAARAGFMREVPIPVRQQIVVRNYNNFLDLLAFEGQRAGVLDFRVIQKVWSFFCPLYPFC
jgi:hypothetical protein